MTKPNKQKNDEKSNAQETVTMTKEELEKAKKAAYEAGIEKGKEIGKEEGQKVGFQEGKETGFKNGDEKGYQRGYAKGKVVGEKEGYSQGYKDGVHNTYPIAYGEGRLSGKRDIVTSIEIKMADSMGFKDRQKWANEGKVPSWWIAVLMANWEPPMLLKEPEEKVALSIPTEEGIDKPSKV